jgi:hypothetical protein
MLWQRIEQRLDSDLPRWRASIDDFRQVSAIEEREQGRRWSDDEIFKGLFLSVLSSSTDWSKVERVGLELSAVVHGFSITWYGALSPADVSGTLVPWFQSRKAGSLTLNKSLQRLIETAKQLSRVSQSHGSLEDYLGHILSECGRDPKSLALALGESSSSRKLPGLGVALAAEFLKNIGYDVCKPDRHINRAAGSFGLVQFTQWPDRQGTS